MTFGQIRFIKRILLVLFLALGLYVGRHVWEGVRTREGSASRSADEPDSPVSREIQIEQLDSEGRIAWTLKAAESIGRTESAQQFRDVEIRFDAGEEKIPVVVTADHCEIQRDSSVYLEGNVVVRDDTSLRLEATTLHFERSPDRAWSSDPVRYFKEGLAGSAGSMSYRLEDGALELEGGVDATFREEGDAPLRVESMRSSMRRRRHFVQFVDEVRVRQANRALDCNDLQIYLDEENENVERLEAFESVDLRMDVAESETPESSSSASLSSEAGTKRLLTEKLEAFFRPGGEDLERVRALEGGRLVMTLPPGAREGYHKDLEGYTLVFEFDEEGRLDVLRGRGGVTLVLTAVAPDAEPRKIVNARQLEAFFDPVSGDLREAICEKAVTFEQGDVRATAEKGTFRNLDSELVLEDEPRLWDERASLEATVIEIDVVTGDVVGSGNVRSTSTDSSGSAGLFPAESDEPVYFASRRLRYVRATDTAVYTGEARGIQGQNRIEAGRIRLLQGSGELAADDEVKTTFLQKAKNSDPEVTVTDADRFHYSSKDETLQYQGGVAMRSKGMTLKGKKVDVLLEAGSREVREVLAEGDVTIETPDGNAAGEHAKYLPEEESMTVRGENARLENAGKLTEGKQLTFFLGNDRILVDGREQTRTKTTYSSKPRL
jgi:LPS export ABC transporter protein LptC/lipopolysaccharide transport protein LptA